ncbi:type II toxin-antitoxin system VapB family antitoxin [Ornithinimicrobium cryptoxanthini]|uniref:Type II toxin-antitoxin system VapB family antitoxin n=1 Tax=Ornithinimicrobium cryptoxanthini TaxID=2934161 RepID=A0ABY4YFY1_9MICO|nr:type II toxin-antitoxin system VapB family antitoxin [Ornithinimicrobium cryptoxanthini]USQ75676.1 type II toxin-antitoxin system VapB family antitoxin [Ornithinimicrobium cryptoxanthini]
MSLNIKNPTTHRLVRELAAATGQSQTAAVEDAVRRRLREVQSESGPTVEHRDRHARARRIAEAFREDLSEDELRRIRHSEDWLYDEHGLPR